MSILNTLGIKPYSKSNDKQAELFSINFRKKLDRGDYLEAEMMLMKASDQNRERMIYGFATSENSVQISAAWATKHPRSAFANIVVGASLIVSGWKIRGGNYAEDVADNAWAPFLSKLGSAEEPLLRAAKIDASIAEPYSWLIHSGLGQGASREDQHRLFVEATSRAPLHWPAHYKYFNVLTEKWGGSHDEMFDFVRHSTRKAPRGNVLHCLTPSAYNDFALSIVSARGVNTARQTLRKPQFAEEVAAALYAWLDATPENLPSKLDNVSGGFSSYGLNQFGVALYLCGARREAKAVLDALQGEIESVPWAWIADGVKERLNPAFVYDRACGELGIDPSR
ncbi:MAG: hypothetical protein JSR83_17770 [Proteobacteria bacterium]|nr:hypothetical protein [Pseudomonadota bacterium]